jgi:hypothetical protein
MRIKNNDIAYEVSLTCTVDLLIKHLLGRVNYEKNKKLIPKLDMTIFLTKDDTAQGAQGAGCVLREKDAYGTYGYTFFGDRKYSKKFKVQLEILGLLDRRDAGILDNLYVTLVTYGGALVKWDLQDVQRFIERLSFFLNFYENADINIKLPLGHMWHGQVWSDERIDKVKAASDKHTLENIDASLLKTAVTIPSYKASEHAASVAAMQAFIKQRSAKRTMLKGQFHRMAKELRDSKVLIDGGVVLEGLQHV